MFHEKLTLPLTITMVFVGLVSFGVCAINVGTDMDSKLLWAQSEEVEYEYFCPMHPQVISDKPGKCPICGMPLSKRPKVRAGAEEGGLPEVPAIQLSPRQIRMAGVKVEPVEYRSLTKTIYTVGTITYDERRLAYVTARVAGRVDKLFVNFTGVEVEEGAPLVWIYSPDLVSAQQEYLLALETQEKMKNSTLKGMVRSADYLLEASRDKLLLWGITEKQIEELAKTGKVEDHMTIYAPITGTVIKKDILEGQYVEEGTRMYMIAELTYLWMMADVYEYEMSLIKLGQKVEITSATFPGQTFIGEVSFIDPFINEITRSVKVRVDVPNQDQKLKPSMFVNATIKIPLGDAADSVYYCPMHPEVTSPVPGVCEKCGGMELVKKPPGMLSIPRSAVLDTGLRKIIYVEKEPGLFEAREIKTGFGAEGYVQVLEGLMEGEKVAAAGAFLIDAETKLGPGVGMQYYGATGGPEGEEAAPPPGGHAAHGMKPSAKAPQASEKPTKEIVKMTRVQPETESAVGEEMRPIPIGASPVDPVCGMDVEGPEGISVRYNDGIFYFCSTDCKKHFESNPEFFARRHWAFKEEGTVDPVCGLELQKSRATRYTYNNKEYYFCCDHCKGVFREDPEKYLLERAQHKDHEH